MRHDLVEMRANGQGIGMTCRLLTVASVCGKTQSAPDRAGYVGTDNWKLGRTAAWFIAQTVHRPGRIALFIGNHRYQCQDIADASFRSYIRVKAGSESSWR